MNALAAFCLFFVSTSALASGTSIGNSFPCSEGSVQYIDTVGEGTFMRETYLCRNGRIVNITPGINQQPVRPRRCIEGERTYTYEHDRMSGEGRDVPMICSGGRFRRIQN